MITQHATETLTGKQFFNNFKFATAIDLKKMRETKQIYDFTLQVRTYT